MASDQDRPTRLRDDGGSRKSRRNFRERNSNGLLGMVRRGGLEPPRDCSH